MSLQTDRSPSATLLRIHRTDPPGQCVGCPATAHPDRLVVRVVSDVAMGEACRADHPNGIKLPLRPDAAKRLHWRRSIGAMDDTRSDDLIRRNHELLAAAAKAWSDFMETVARIDHMRAQKRMWRALLVPVAGG